MPERNALVKALKDKPIKFLAIAAHLTQAEASAYAQQARLAMPIYGDHLDVMQKRYGIQISLKNIWKYRVIGPDGRIIGTEMRQALLEAWLRASKAEWKFKSETDDPKLQPAADAFEWGRHAQGMKLLVPLRRYSNKAVASSAEELYERVKKEAEAWKEEAESLVETDPVRAYDLYSRLTGAFTGDSLGQSVAGSLTKLRTTKEVRVELTARRAFAQATASWARLTPAQKGILAKQLRAIAKRYEGSPTAEQAAALAKDLSN